MARLARHQLSPVFVMVRYYYCNDGANVEGPVEYPELVQLVRKGEIVPETPVCTEGIDKWWTAGHFVREPQAVAG